MNQIEEKFSYSRVSCYLSCPYKHYLRYVERVEKAAKSRPLYFGTDFHKLLELRGDKKALKAQLKQIEEQFYELPPNQQSELGDNYPQDIRQIFSDYRKMWKGTPIPDRTEKEFEIPILTYKGTDVIFHGVIDGMYYNYPGTDNFVIEEHKTFNKKPDSSTMVMNTQKCLYAKAAFFLTGSFPDEVMWDYIKSTPAQQPVWLEKSGRFSTASNQNITPYSWKRACDERGIEDEEIRSLGAKYEPNLSNFFFRSFQDFIPEMVEEVFEGFKYTCRDILRQGSKNKTKNITFNCSFCDYFDLCYSQMTGGNVNYLFDSGYFVKGDEEE